jgi:hypothetical protein
MSDDKIEDKSRGYYAYELVGKPVHPVLMDPSGTPAPPWNPPAGPFIPGVSSPMN